ncbi:MAG: tRNA (adenosine(37)-N6)-threonylcarbamoyltransferase complex dimerization subunit type 1 TsaB [Clostridia bacterium]|nr:tRNA (adenosine(37)-N6)-threonylcarbamoyltransferase complex dimerization subunit type 1 TsaB [Clostridia bacterium]
MKILAFETTDAVASVAILLDGEVFETVIDTDRRHAESVLPAVEALLSEHGLSTADMDAFAADVGPGSFTGVRIGVCMANALGAAHHKPVVAVDALETLAYPYRGETVCALIDARNGNGYGALYRNGESIKPPCACVIAEFASDLPENCRMVGTATDDPQLPSAANVARIAAARAGEKEIAPLYLKLSQAERMWKA